jgi:hypothetical protein
MEITKRRRTRREEETRNKYIKEGSFNKLMNFNVLLVLGPRYPF